MSIYNNQFLDNLDNNKSREMGTPYNGNSTLTQFNRTMKREGKTVTTYTGGTEFQAFFRIKEDNENQKETIIMYYDITAPVRPGTLVMYGYGIFLALNRETVENDIYYKSVLVKCNGVFNDINGYFGNIPFYCDNMKSSVSIGNSIITTLSGNIEFITEENALSKNIKIDNYFNEFGRTFRVSNRYVIDGIVHIIGEVEADRTPTVNYSIVIDGIPASSVKVGDSISLSATPYRNGSITTGATFEWSSDNTSVATVDEVGNVSIIAEGSAHITVLWVETNTKENCIINVSNGSSIQTLSAYISGGSTIRYGRVKNWTTTIYDMSENDVTESTDFTWNIANCNFTNSIKQTVTGNKIQLKIDEEALLDELFTLEVLYNNNVIGSQDITIMEGF